MLKPILLILLALAATFLSYKILLPKKYQETSTLQQEKVLAEKIPGSKFHSPDATWWGYNQSKIVRYKDKVFTYYINNGDDSNKTSSRFVVMKKDGDKPWEEGATFQTSRPGNLLIDSKGILHAFVFEPFDVVKNDSWGKIIHYYFPNSAQGDIENYKQETVVDNDGTSETANIRVGAAIGKDDTMAISFGLTKFNPLYKEQSEHVYYKKPNEEVWNHTFIDNLPHDYFYPFTLVSENIFYLLLIQDDYVPPKDSVSYPNIYQKIIFMGTTGSEWKTDLVADLSSHSLAKSKPRLLEQEDLYEAGGIFHILYKEFLDEKNEYAATAHWHLSGIPGGKWEAEKVELEKPGVNWIRLVEIKDNLYYLITTFDELFISPVENINLVKIDTPKGAKGAYPYVSTIKGGSAEGNFTDVLLLGADQKLFQEGKTVNYYIRIPNSKFSSLKQLSP